jgi:hypothetical protein
MKKHLLLSLIIGFSPIMSYAQISQVNTINHKINVGIKGGFNTVLFFADKIVIGDQSYNEVENNYRVGNFISMFMRINLKKDFLQPEIAYHVSRGDLLFDKNQNDATATKRNMATISSKITSIEIPLLYGHHIIKRDQCGMALFLGPKIKYIWNKKSNTNFTNFDRTDIHEDLQQFNLNIVAGLGVNISNLFFDFRYEQGLNNISKSIGYTGANTESTSAPVIKVSRSASQLNFSLGVIF